VILTFEPLFGKRKALKTGGLIAIGGYCILGILILFSKAVVVAGNETKFMKRALFLAQNRSKYASPNPRVGAVLVKNGKIVGEGATQPYGGDHAEIVALRRAGSKARGATLFVTLEPCSHFGKTPPCVNALLRSGIRKVVAAMEDPFPLVSGRGFKILKKAGVGVRVGLLKKEAEKLNEDFIFSVTHGRPKVLLKAALSGDGKIAPAPGGARWITGPRARQKAHQLRSQVDAILVGSATARSDDPFLTVRLPGYGRKDGWPLRVLLDSRLKTGLRSRIFQGHPRTAVFTSFQAPRKRKRALEKKGILVFPVPQVKKMLSLRAILKILHSLQVRKLMVEGGGKIHASFLKERLMDEAALFLSPAILGEKALDWMGSDGVPNLKRLPYLQDVRAEKLGRDVLLTGQFRG